MLEIAYGEGIRYMTATPHFMAGNGNAPVKKLKEVLRQVQRAAAEIGQDMRIFLGNELYYSEGVLDLLEQGEALTINGSRYVLMEFNVRESYDVIYGAFQDMTQRGYMPIIAHIERYGALFKKYDRIEELIGLGVYVQVNISSLLGGVTDSVAGFCRKLLKQDMIHIFGTDAHRDVGRAPYMGEGASYIERKFGKETAERLLITNPKKILMNKII
jgi:protein-tyrosine phosphatase